MNKLLTFGCSMTFGHGLVDCWHPNDRTPGHRPSKYAWPALLGKQLDLQTENLSRPGSSNREIWWKIVNTNFHRYDTVVILWSLVARYCIVTDNDFPEIQMGVWKTNPESAIYSDLFRYNNDFNLSVESLTFVNHANSYLQRQGVTRVYNYAVNHEEWTSVVDQKWNHTHIIGYANDIWAGVNDVALDNAHPGNKMHIAFAKEVCKNIKGETHEN